MVRLKSPETFATVFILILCLIILDGCRQSPETNSAPANAVSNIDAGSERGEQVVWKYLNSDTAPFRQSRLRFTITSESEPPTVYEVDVWRRQNESGTSTLTHIIKPAEDSDLSSLINEPPDQDAVVTTYIASRNEFRETGTNKAFFGGVPTEELLGEWTKYSYRFIGEKDLDGVKVNEVEGKLLPAKHSLAARISAFFRADNFLPIEIHLFDSSGKELRTFKITGYQTANNRTYISTTEIDNNIYQTKVKVEVLAMTFPAHLDDAVFTREQLQKNAKK